MGAVGGGNFLGFWYDAKKASETKEFARAKICGDGRYDGTKNKGGGSRKKEDESLG